MVLTEGTRAVDPVRRPDRRPLPGAGGRRRRHQRAQAGRHDPAGPHRAGAGPRRADRRLPAAVPGAGSRPGQRVDRPADRGASGPGRDDQLVPGPDRGGDEHAGRPRPADRRGRSPTSTSCWGRSATRATSSPRPSTSLSELVEGLADAQGRHQQRGGATPTPPPARIADLLAQARPPFAEDGRTRPTVPPASWWPTTTTSTTCSTPCPTRTKRSARQGIYGDFFSFYLCDHGAEAQRQGRPAGVRQGRRPDHRDGARRNEALRRTQPVRHRRRRAWPSPSAIVLGALQLRQAAVPQPAATSTRRTSPKPAACEPVPPCRCRVSRWARSQSIELDGPRVLVKFNVDKNVRLGDRTEAAIKTKSLLGTKILEVTSARRRPAGRAPSPSSAPRRPTNCPMRWAIWRPRSAA